MDILSYWANTYASYRPSSLVGDSHSFTRISLLSRTTIYDEVPQNYSKNILMLLFTFEWRGVSTTHEPQWL